jgi:hypothetical protein
MMIIGKKFANFLFTLLIFVVKFSIIKVAFLHLHGGLVL